MLSFGALVVEGLTLKKDPSVEETWRLVIADAVQLFPEIASTI
jgi:putative membrane protein